MGILKYLKFTSVVKRFWWVLALLIVCMPLIISSFNEARETGDYGKIIIDAGEGILLLDSKLNDSLTEANIKFEDIDSTNELIDESGKFTWNLFNKSWKYIWVYLSIFSFFYAVAMFTLNDAGWSKKLKSSVFSFVCVFLLQVIGSIVSSKKPFEGLTLFFKLIFKFLGTI